MAKNRFNHIMGISEAELNDAPKEEVQALINSYTRQIEESGMNMTEAIKCTFPIIARIMIDKKEDKRAEELYKASGRHDDRVRRFDKTRKGITLTGGVGNGKTMSMRCVESITGARLLSVPALAIDYMRGGIDEVVKRFGSMSGGDNNRPHIIIDDLGAECDAKSYGQKFPIEEIIMIRYNELHKYGTLTHFATNLNGREISARYGERILDRIKEMTTICSIASGSMRK